MEQPYDPSSRADVEARRNRLELLRRRSDAAFRRLMEDRAFRAFVWGLLERTHVFETSFDPCPHVMAFREGERNAGLALLDRVNRLCPGHYPTMVDEHHGDEHQGDEHQGDEHHADEHRGNEEEEDERHDD